jgi:hypothetical protein
MLDSNDSFIDEDCKGVLAPYFLEVLRYMTRPTSCWSFFVETESENHCSARSEARFEKGGNAGEHGKDVVLAVLSASTVDVLAIKVAGEGGILPLKPSIGSNWNNLGESISCDFGVFQMDTLTS